VSAHRPAGRRAAVATGGGTRAAAPRGPAASPGVAALLALQRGAGNRAVARRVLARRGTGMREAAPGSTYVKAVAAHYRDAVKRRATLDDFALVLAGEAIKTLGGLGVHPPKPGTDAKVPFPGQFDPVAWTLTMNTTMWAPKSGARTVDGMTTDEAATAVGLLYHEARHAEQHFRMARVQAGEHVRAGVKDVAGALERGMQLRPDVARAAAASPLHDTAATADLVAEARDWHAITRGRHLPFKNIVIPWNLEVRGALKLFDGLNPMQLDPVRTGLAPLVRAWSTGATRAQLLVTHRKAIDRLPKKTAGDREVLAQISALKTASDGVTASFTALDKAWPTAGPRTRLDLVTALRAKVRALVDALDAAYRAEPHEKDAFDAEVPVVKEFRAAIGAP